MPSADEKIQSLIHQYPVVVFSKTYCPYCQTAKTILSKYSLDKEKKYHLLELDHLSNGNEYQDELKKLTGDRSVPQIFIGGKCIGDEDDLNQLEKKGTLKDLLKQAKAIDD